MTGLSGTDSEVRPPVVVCENGDIDIFRSAVDAERYLEPIDVENGRFVAYDGVGHRLTLEVVTRKRKVLGGLFTLRDKAVVVGTEQRSDASNEGRLRSILIDYLQSMSADVAFLKEVPIGEVIARAVERIGYTT